MKTLINKFPCLLLLITGSAVFLLSSAWIPRIHGRNPITSVVAGNLLSPDEFEALKARFAKFRLINEASSAKC